MSGKRKYDEKHYSTTWEDLTPWLEQLWEEYGLRAVMEVSIEPAQADLAPTCVLELYRTKPGGKREEVVRDYKAFRYRSTGAVEATFLQMLSRALLDLENEKWRAERQQTLWAAL